MKKLSIVAKNPHVEEHVVGFYNTGDRTIERTHAAELHTPFLEIHRTTRTRSGCRGQVVGYDAIKSHPAVSIAAPKGPSPGGGLL